MSQIKKNIIHFPNNIFKTGGNFLKYVISLNICIVKNLKKNIVPIFRQYSITNLEKKTFLLYFILVSNKEKTFIRC